MVEAIGALGQFSAASAIDAPPTQTLDARAAALREPTAADTAAFARAAASQPVGEIQATPPARSDGLSSRLADQADDLSAHLASLNPMSPGHDVPNSKAGPASTAAKDQMDQAVAQMERAYMLAIETTMISRGSTEATKIFNTLLKGQ
jgi:hypothetical protein